MDIGKRLIRLTGDESVALSRYDTVLPVSELPALKRRVAALFAEAHLEQLWAASGIVPLAMEGRPPEAVRVQQILAAHRYSTICSIVIDIIGHELAEETEGYLQDHQRSN